MVAYFISSGLSILSFYLFYISFLAKGKTHSFNRHYLLITLILSMTIPLFNFFPSEGLKTISSLMIPDGKTGNPIRYINNDFVQNISLSASLSKILLTLYFAIAAIMLIRFMINITRLIYIIRKNQSISFRNSRIVLVNRQILPFTFVHNIFVNQHDYSSNKIDDLLIEHELAHVNQNHSVDIIFVELVQALLWLNPILILYKKAIKQNHEFLADNTVLEISKNPSHYQELLMSIVAMKSSPYFGNSFNSSLTKKRLIMINKTESPIWLSLSKKIIAILVIVTLSTALIFSQEKLENKVLVKGTWEYSQKDFTGTKVQSSSGQVAFKDVSVAMSNKSDSIKMIKAKQAYRNLNDNKWHFETGEVSTYNKFGKGKKQSFDKLEVEAIPLNSDNKK